METRPSRWARWKTRRPTRAVRWVASTILLVGFALWVYSWHQWAHARPDLLSGRRPMIDIVAVATYWPMAIAAWLAAYPGSGSALPWADKDSDEPRP